MNKPAENHSRRMPKPINNVRAHQRRELSAPIPVYDIVNDVSIGALINVTVEGMMIMSSQEISPQQIYQIELRVPAESDGSDETTSAGNAYSSIEVSVDCLWCRNEESNQHYWAGFQIVDATQSAIKRIENLIRDHGL